jgi:hypothetical protein
MNDQKTKNTECDNKNAKKRIARPKSNKSRKSDQIGRGGKIEPIQQQRM